MNGNKTPEADVHQKVKRIILVHLLLSALLVGYLFIVGREVKKISGQVETLNKQLEQQYSFIRSMNNVLMYEVYKTNSNTNSNK